LTIVKIRDLLGLHIGHGGWEVIVNSKNEDNHGDDCSNHSNTTGARANTFKSLFQLHVEDWQKKEGAI
jgi:hypothetical protein